jgi:hypothetical protein
MSFTQFLLVVFLAIRSLASLVGALNSTEENHQTALKDYARERANPKVRTARAIGEVLSALIFGYVAFQLAQ